MKEMEEYSTGTLSTYSTVGTRGITRTLHNLKNANRQGKYQYTVRTVWRMSLSSK